MNKQERFNIYRYLRIAMDAAENVQNRISLLEDAGSRAKLARAWKNIETSVLSLNRMIGRLATSAAKRDWPGAINVPSLDELKHDPTRTRNLDEDIRTLKEVAQWMMKHGDKAIALKLTQIARAVELGQATQAKPLYDKLAATGHDSMVPRRVIDAIHARASVMKTQQENDIIRTLCKAGHEALAKAFARSRGYCIKAAEVTMDDVKKFRQKEARAGDGQRSRLPIKR